VASLRRILELWALYTRLDILFVWRDPGKAIAYYASDLVIGVAAVTATFLLAQRFDGIGAWSRHQVIFLLGYALLVRGCINTLFNFNVAQISRRIGRGQLDHVLVQPQPMWMVLLTEGFAPVSGGGMLAPGAVLVVWSVGQLGIEISPGWLAVFALYLVSSVTIIMAFDYAWASVAFWAPRAAEEINSSTWRLMTELNQFPLDGLSSMALMALVTVVPVGLVAWLPSRALLTVGFEWWTALAPVLGAALISTVALFIFTRGLRHYADTGSARYLPYGHRN
jgi:viologen exporter family transport system permease protein